MSFRTYCFGILMLVAAFLSGEVFAPAQVPTDFTLWKDAQNAENVPEMARRMLASRDFRDLTGTAREELLANTLSGLADIASDSQIVPSTRYNAILAIGQLESRPGTPPAAYPAALIVLVDAYQKADTPHYLKCGALLGIVRHAICGIDPVQQDKIIDLLLETATTEFVAGEGEPLEPMIVDWFRLSALDGLSALKTVGTDGNVATTLLSVMNQKSQELENLCRLENTLTRENWEQSCRTSELASKVAKTLGDLDYKSASGIDTQKMTDAFIRLTKAVCDVKGKIAADFLEQERTTPEPAILLEQIVLHVKMCTQSVIWGGRSGILTNRPSENSFYASLEKDEPAIKRLDVLLSEVRTLTTFFDEGEKSRRSAAIANFPQAFRFDLSELRDALEKCSEALTEVLEIEQANAK